MNSHCKWIDQFVQIVQYPIMTQKCIQSDCWISLKFQINLIELDALRFWAERYSCCYSIINLFFLLFMWFHLCTEFRKLRSRQNRLTSSVVNQDINIRMNRCKSKNDHTFQTFIIENDRWLPLHFIFSLSFIVAISKRNHNFQKNS